MPEAYDVVIGEITSPDSTGFSSETLMFDATWHTHGGEVRDRLVARVAPTTYQVFLEPAFEEQYRVQRLLHDHTEIDADVPLPPLHWYEPDVGILGAPFFVMGLVEGRIPTDTPPYHTGGWVTEVEPA